MKAFNYQKAIDMGYSPEEIDAFLNESKVSAPVINKPEQPIPQPTPQPTTQPTVEPPSPISPLSPNPAPVSTPAPVKEPTPIPQTPDYVDPFRSPLTTEVTQYMGENPQFYGAGGHQGIDLVNPDTSVTNPIGGIAISGYQPGGYGNYSAVVGANPQELSQMDPAQKTEIIDRIKNYMGTATDLRGLDTMGKNISLQGHLAEPAPEGEIATGSANLIMGGSGGWDPHLHQEMKDTQGEMTDVQKILGSYPKSEMYYGPSIDFNEMAREQIKKRLKK